MFPCISRKLILQKSIFKHIQKYAVLRDAIDVKQSVEVSLKILGKSFETLLDNFHFIVNLYSFPLPSVPKVSLPSPRWAISPFSGKTTFKFPPTIDTLTIGLVCIFSSDLSHSYNHVYNTFKLFDGWSNFAFITSGTKLVYTTFLTSCRTT